MKILTVKGLEFMLDDDIYERVKGFRWSLISGRYATRKITTKVGRITFMLHWEVIGAPPIGLTIDHADGNTFNTQRSNLRFATPRQQKMNKKSWCECGLKGVKSTNNKKNPWMARIRLNGKEVHIGVFKTKKEASDAYFEAAKRLFGEFASQ